MLGYFGDISLDKQFSENIWRRNLITTISTTLLQIFLKLIFNSKLLSKLLYIKMSISGTLKHECVNSSLTIISVLWQLSNLLFFPEEIPHANQIKLDKSYCIKHLDSLKRKILKNLFLHYVYWHLPQNPSPYIPYIRSKLFKPHKNILRAKILQISTLKYK